MILVTMKWRTTVSMEVRRSDGKNDSGSGSWSEHLKFGVISHYVTTVDFRRSASVLVLQQQV